MRFSVCAILYLKMSGFYGPMTNAGVPNVGVDKRRSGHFT